MKQKLIKIIKFLYSNPLILSQTILLFSFIFSRLPFFIWLPIPEFYNDTCEYCYSALQMQNGYLPDIAFLPPGYPVFLYLINLFSDKVITIVLIQNLLTLASSLFLVYVVAKYYKKISIAVSIAISIFIMDTVSIYHDSNILTESIYTSSLIFWVAMFIFAFNSKNKFVWLVFSVSFFFPAFIRSNGIYTYFFMAIGLIFLFVNKFKKKHYFYLLLPLFLINLAWASYNYYKSDMFMFGNPGRYKTTIIKTLNNIQPFTNQKQPHDRIRTFTMYWLQIAVRNNNFYFKEIPRRFEELYVFKKRRSNRKHKSIFGNFIVNKEVQEYMFKEYNSTILDKKLIENVIKADVYNYLNQRDKPGKKYYNIWLFMYYNYYLFHNLFFRSFIWIFLFLYIFAKTGIKLIKSKFKDKQAFIINTLTLVHLLSIIIITLMHGRYIDRYEKVSSFLYYIVPALYLYSSLIFDKIKNQIKYKK